MTDRDAFLRAIRAHPDDDTPRLIFADWLDDRGDPAQAEFVRLQVELEPIREQLDQPRVRELTERESILLATHGHDWLGPAADLVGPYPAFGPVFRRGLPEMVCLSLGTFLDRAAELFAACPTVREVCVYGVSGRGAELAACPQLGQVETLEIADPSYRDDLEAVVAFSHAMRDARLRCLRIPALYDPHLIHQLCGVIATGWPRWVEFVEHLHDVDTDCRGYAAALDRIAGRAVTRIVRPYEGRFPLFGQLHEQLAAGYTRAGNPAVAATNENREWHVAQCDEQGRFVHAEDFPYPKGTWPRVKFLVQDLGFTPGLIHVHPFGHTVESLAVRRWPSAILRDYLQNPFERPPGVSDHWWESRGGVLKRWLHEGRFVIEWDGREYTADATGKIIAG